MPISENVATPTRRPACLDAPVRVASGDRGANLVEYSMLIAMIAVVCLAALQMFGTNQESGINDSSSKIDTAFNSVN